MIDQRKSLPRIVQVASQRELSDARLLFEEYAGSLDFSLSFQDFDREMASLPGEYAPPFGRLFLTYVGEEVSGCVALRSLETDICEMKRLYVRPGFRGAAIGKALVECAIRAAREIGYRKIRLDTVPSMERARALYTSLGFYEIPPYRYNPVQGAIYMELDLVL